MTDQGSGTLAGATEREVSIRLKRPPPAVLVLAGSVRSNADATAARF